MSKKRIKIGARASSSHVECTVHQRRVTACSLGIAVNVSVDMNSAFARDVFIASSAFSASKIRT